MYIMKRGRPLLFPPGKKIRNEEAGMKISRMMIMVMITFLFSGMVVRRPVPADAARIPVKIAGRSTHLSGRPVSVRYGSVKVMAGRSRDLTAIKIGSVVYVPCRSLFCDATVRAKYRLSDHSQRVTLRRGKRRVTFRNHKKSAFVNGTSMKLSARPYFVTFKKSGVKDLLVPARQAALFLGLRYGYDHSSATVWLKNRDGIEKSATRSSQIDKSDFIETIGPIARNNYRRTGILASVTISQAILESGWGHSRLAVRGNNLFGMKKNLSGNNWKGSTWDHRNTSSGYRKYSCIEDSIEDHSRYLLGAMSGSHHRYGGITRTKSYRKQISIIRRGGYCTSGSYRSYLIRLIRRYHLTKWDH